MPKFPCWCGGWMGLRHRHTAAELYARIDAVLASKPPTTPAPALPGERADEEETDG